MKEKPKIPETEEEDWQLLTPKQRFEQYCILYDFYIKSGGSIAPERDSQSPFDFPEYYSAKIYGP